MVEHVLEDLEAFASENDFKEKGALSIALVVTQHARQEGLPLNPETLVTKGGGQVRGAGKGAVQAVLKRYDIDRVLAAEGGRTSRNSLNNMRAYVALLNELHEEGRADLDVIERFWIDCVQAFFASKPFTITLDSARNLPHAARIITEPATERQKEGGGTYHAGAVLQHLVGAKLDCAMGEGKFEHYSFSTADAPGGRAGDFFIGDVAIHVTTSPNEAVITRCKDNLKDGYRPMLVTTQRKVSVAEGLAENQGLSERIDIFEIEQFVALNLYELAGFAEGERRVVIGDLVGRYNRIIEAVETDPSLKIEIK